MPVGESFGLYASGVKLKFRYDPRKNYCDNTRELNRLLMGRSKFLLLG